MKTCKNDYFCAIIMLPKCMDIEVIKTNIQRKVETDLVYTRTNILSILLENRCISIVFPHVETAG